MSDFVDKIVIQESFPDFSTQKHTGTGTGILKLKNIKDTNIHEWRPFKICYWLSKDLLLAFQVYIDYIVTT